jgi:hypothetical protein
LPRAPPRYPRLAPRPRPRSSQGPGGRDAHLSGLPRRGAGRRREEPIEIRRVERSQAADGVEVRTERVIATGVATDQITAQDSWVAVNLDDVKAPILEGDVVRRYFQKDLIENLTGPNCKKILVER